MPVLVKNGETWARESLPLATLNGVNYRIQRYRPRIEGLFARIERWTNPTERATSIGARSSKDNITTWYGKTPESRIADPAGSDAEFSAG